MEGVFFPKGGAFSPFGKNIQGAQTPKLEELGILESCEISLWSSSMASSSFGRLSPVRDVP